MVLTIRQGLANDYEDVRRINSESLSGVSEIDPVEFSTLLRISAIFRIIENDGVSVGYLFAIGQQQQYDGEEYQWFSENEADNFYYIDQIAIAQQHRGLGIATALYDDLDKCARQHCIQTLLCEVNSEPANHESLYFHQKRGFSSCHKIT